MRVTLCLFLLCSTLQLVAQTKYQSQVIDAETNEPLAFVSVVLKGQSKGTITDIDGRFTITTSEPNDIILFSYVGYENLEKSALEITNIITLRPSTEVLKEVTILAGENPAHPIIRKLIKNKKRLDPKSLASYSYDSYNKFLIGNDYVPEIDEEDSAQINLRDLISSNYFFSMESVTAKYYKRPSNENEIVLANKVSGFKNPQFTALANSFQNIGFFDDYITILDIPFLNPISKGSFDNYYFEVTDSIYDSDNRKAYVITFEPEKKTFNGLTGTLYVDAQDYALRNVSAETVKFSEMYSNMQKGESVFGLNPGMVYMFETSPSLNFKIQQNYQQFDTLLWFPNQLKIEFFFGEMTRKNSPSFPLLGIGKSYLNDIKINPELDSIKFRRTKLKYAQDANKKDSNYWNNVRPEPITEKEEETYAMVDSISQKAKLEQIVNISSYLINKKIPLGKVDINLHRAFDINEYEGFRAGLGLSTSRQLSQRFELGGYWAYGFKDKDDKYGGYLDIHLLDEKRLTLFGKYSDDVEQFGQLSNYMYKPFPLESENFYRFSVENMYKVRSLETGFRFYWLKFIDTEISIESEQVSATNDYRFVEDEALNPLNSNFDLSTFKIKLGYNPGMHLVNAFDQLLYTSRSNSYVGFTYSHGFASLNGDYQFNKYEIMLQRKFMTRNLGHPTFTLQAGYVDEVIPAFNYFNLKGSSDYLLDVSNSFRTMGINEFVADKFVNVFYQHYLTRFTIDQKFSKPQFYLVGAGAYGEIEDRDRHVNLLADAPSQYYFEGGVLIKGLLKVLNQSIGVGGYYRFGNYSFDNFEDNLFIKLDISFDTGE